MNTPTLLIALGRPPSFRSSVCLLGILFSLGFASHLEGAAVVRMASGPSTSSIFNTIQQFRADLGGGLNPNVSGSFLTGRREINWDGVPDEFAAPNNLPKDFFNINSPRGVVVRGNTGANPFQVSANFNNPTATDVRFGNLNPNYPAIFKTFSSEGLFTQLNGKDTIIDFFVPGTSIPASVSGFGAVFTDVDNTTATTIKFRNSAGTTFATITVPAADDGLSFVGVTFDAGERVGSVEISTGTVALASSGPDDADGAASTSDVVVMDDFIYGEPVPFPDVLAINDANGELIRFNARFPGNIISNAPVTGLRSGTVLLGIDFRPANGQLYAVGSDNGLYTIDPQTAAATLVAGLTASTFDSFTSLSGTFFGVDFNPVADRLRVVSDAEQNLRINPDTGVVNTDMALNPGNPNIVASAYSDNGTGAPATTLFGISSFSDALFMQNPPNDGTLALVGALDVDTNSLAGFDIEPFTNLAYATLSVTTGSPPVTRSNLFTMSLVTGKATAVSLVIGASLITRAMAVVPSAPSASAPSYHFSAPTYSVGEGDSTATITVTRTGSGIGNDGAFRVTVSTNTTGASATEGVACNEGIDYIDVVTQLTFSDAEPNKTFTVSICDDALVEGNETLNLLLSGPTSGAVLGSPSSAVLTINDNDSSATPTPTPTPGGSPSPTPTATPIATATPTPNPSATPTPTATPVTTLANISTRLRVETGDNVLIGGFIVTGTQPKKVIVRAIGTSLSLPDKLANPTMELHGPNGLIEANDNWVDSPNKQAIIDSTIPPSSDLEAAIVQTLPAAAGYTAIVRGVNNGTGIGVVEAYDLDTTVDSRLANISTRGFVQTGDNVLIAGTIVVGQASQRVLIRAIGPSLPIAGVMANPTLELRDASGTLLQDNDNWMDSADKQAIIDTTIPPTHDLESAIVATLPANNASYTAIVRGVNDTTGIAVVEVYALQ